MITKEKIKRINELAAKYKREGLTDEELNERDILRREYIDSITGNLIGHLSNIKIVDKEDKDIKKNN